VAATRSRTRAGRRLLNRELSWLDFNARVLELAADARLPLLERVKFCSIFSSNLDEFFMVRVAGLLRQAASGHGVRSPDGRTPHQTLDEIRERVSGLVAAQAELWSRELRPALAVENILIAALGDCTDEELAEVASRYEREIFPVLTPLAVGPGQPFPYISGLSLSLGVFVRDLVTGEQRFARVKVPEGLPRYLEVGSRGLHLPLESVIAHFLPSLFPGMEIVERGSFRVTRDADFEVSDEADDLLEAVELEVRRRRFGDVTRLEVSGSMSAEMTTRVREGLGATPDQVYPVNGSLGLADLMEITRLDRPELKDDPWLPALPPRLGSAAGTSDFFAAIRAGDVLVHHPYESFASSVEAFVRAGASDPGVIGLKTTVYRTSDDTPLVPALIAASEEGKQSVCLVELKARFDEHRNIEWSRALERAGVHVVHGFPNLKIHAKTILIVRREAGSLRRYVHVGTGNYNASTARLYEDFGLFTVDDDIATDVTELFNYLTGFSRPQRFRKLLVAPFSLRARLAEEIRAVGAAAAADEPARIRIKVNALTDEALIEELYTASQQGARIEIVARSICTLRPGVRGMSETIRVRSILGRFLEHSRLFVFEAGRRSTVLIGSADLMPRNLDHRIEVVTPLEDPALKAHVTSVLDALLADNVSAWELGSDGRWTRAAPKKDERERPTQQALMRRARRREPTGG
jgi:polyphosphate kinase